MWKNILYVGLLSALGSMLPFTIRFVQAKPLTQSQADGGAASVAKPAQFVRIELPGTNRILTLAEVEIFSSGKNVATTGKATQSTTDYDAGAMRAIDGNKHRDWSKAGQTHTSNAGSRSPWWELDLQTPTQIESIKIWNRLGYESRLSNCTITLLDANRKVIFQATKVAAGECLMVDVKSGKLTYLTYDDKPGTPKANEPRNRTAQSNRATRTKFERTDAGGSSE